MLKQRETYIRIFSKVALERMENDLCPACCKPKEKWTRRTSWHCCSKECTGNFWKDHVKILDWGVVRAQAFKRDNYTCRKCGKRFVMISKNPDYLDEEFSDSSKLVGDHIIPISLGGSEFDLSNIQTLCIECNKIKTKQDMADIAVARRKDKTREHMLLTGQQTII